MVLSYNKAWNFNWMPNWFTWNETPSKRTQVCSHSRQ